MARLAKANDSIKLSRNGDIVYGGDTKALEAIFPEDGVIRIKQSPPLISGETKEQVEEILAKHNVPVKKQQIIIKPKKLKLPKTVDHLDEETFDDVMYDSDKDGKKKKTQKKGNK